MKLKIVKSLLWFLVGVGVVVGIARFVNGLGATTNLTDTTPWGLWIGFDVMGGVALAAGGFVIAALVYVFKLERFRPILRAAVLTAFLGYMAVAFGLLFDLGLPWNIWHMLVFWNPHSPLFEVGWCVMLYLSVLFLEFAPVWLEKTPFKGVLNFLKKATLPLVILGIMLSTLHQSSLGSLMLIIPFRIYPLWYSPVIPIMFFVSAVGLGLMMVTLESMITTWLYDKEPETKILSGLGKAGVYVFSIYTILKLGDLVFQGKFGMLFNGSWESGLFMFELLITGILPAVLLSINKVRNSRAGLLSCAAMVVTGFVLNRIVISGIATIRATGTEYFPSLMEISISLMVVSGAILVFLFFVENFKVWETEAKSKKMAAPVFDGISNVWKSDFAYNSLKRYSLMFIAGAVAAFSLLPPDAIYGAKPVKNPVERARAAEPMIIDGNRSDMPVVFDHAGHKVRTGGEKACSVCHHMNKPLDKNTPCADCHSDMFVSTNIFNHSFHQEKLNGNEGCVKCHTDPEKPKTGENITNCNVCHKQMRADLSYVKVSPETKKNFAAGYKDAMHGLCISCHKEKKEEVNKPGLSECSACHKDLPVDVQKRLDDLYMRGKQK